MTKVEVRKTLRDFISWQIEKGLIDELTIDYEMADMYLEEQGEVDVCNCDKRDMGTALDAGGIRYCLQCGLNVS